MTKPLGHKEFTKLYYELVDEGITITSKDKKWRWIWKGIHYFLMIVTFGKMDGFYDSFTTTIGRTIAFYEGWTPESAGFQSYITLRHEMVHIRQFERHGTFKMGLMYLFSGNCRYKFEREAYLESIIAASEIGLSVNLEWYVNTLSGPSYFWACRDKKAILEWFKWQLDALDIKYIESRKKQQPTN